jgi:prepilin-type N-terminal cleavage/methylation domain-containing protein
MSARRPEGFSLIEVLVAVVVLAVGLLALAALQGTLARSAADAKARARVALLLSSEFDALRASAYADAVAGTTNASHPECAAPASPAEHAACDGRLRGLRLQRTVSTFGSTVDDASFAAGASRGDTGAEFKLVGLSAQWNTATGEARTLDMRTVLGALAHAPDHPRIDPTRPHAPVRASVHRALAGDTGVEQPDMVPIAIGTGMVSATTMPMPVSSGTRFDVLSYAPVGARARIDARIETQVIKCACRFGAGGARLGPLHREARWPAVWTGWRYAVHVPERATPAPGDVYAAGPAPDVAQSPLCRECCRDRHDNPADATNPKFDAEAPPESRGKFTRDESGALVPVANTISGDYVDACRLVRVDGWWRVAADMHARVFALLETERVDGIPAKTRRPDPDAAARHTRFVRDYLRQYDGTTGDAPANAQAMHDDGARALNPAPIAIPAATGTDKRHLHARALYVDHLAPQARDTLAEILARRRARGECPAATDDLADCVLPHLPFFTLDLTNLATWSASDPGVLRVDSSDPLAADPPPGGRVTALAPGAADAIAAARTSNSGAAASEQVPGATDLDGDEIEASDAQAFIVGDSASSDATSN